MSIIEDATGEIYALIVSSSTGMVLLSQYAPSAANNPEAKASFEKRLASAVEGTAWHGIHSAKDINSPTDSAASMNPLL